MRSIAASLLSRTSSIVMACQSVWERKKRYTDDSFITQSIVAMPLNLIDNKIAIGELTTKDVCYVFGIRKESPFLQGRLDDAW